MFSMPEGEGRVSMFSFALGDREISNVDDNMDCLS